MSLTLDAVDEVRRSVYGAPYLAAQRALMDALREFHTISRSWEAPPDSIAAGAQPQEYVLTYTNKDTEPFELLFAQIGTADALVSMPRNFIRQRANAASLKGPQYVWLKSYVPGSATIEVIRAPDSDVSAALHVTLALRESYAASGVSAVSPYDQVITDPQFDAYREHVVLGAAGRVLLIPNQPWSNLDLGTGYIRLMQEKAREWEQIRPDAGARSTSAGTTTYGGY